MGGSEMNRFLCAVAAAAAMGVASTMPAAAVTVFGNITDTNLSDTTTDGSSYDVLSGPYSFNAFFVGPDGAGQANFKFTNSSASPIVIAVNFETVNQGTAAFAGGVTSSWLAGESHSTPGTVGTVDSFIIKSIIAPGGFDVLKIVYGNPGGNTVTGPNFTLQISALPLPGALPLFVSGLGALGFVGWRRHKKAKLAA